MKYVGFDTILLIYLNRIFRETLMRTLLSATVLSFLIITGSAASMAKDLDLSLHPEDKAALPQLTDEDWNLLKKTAKDALDHHPDSTSHVWKNSNTFNAGVITILSTEKSENRYCRNTRFITNTSELTTTTFVNLCKEGDQWVEASPRSTTTTSNKVVSNSSSSIMFVDPSSFVQSGDSSAANNIKEKPQNAGSDRCQQLANDIKNLKGKPLRQTAARNYYELECLR